MMIDSYYGLNDPIPTVHPIGSAPEPTLIVGTRALFHRKGKLVGNKHAAVLLAATRGRNKPAYWGFGHFEIWPKSAKICDPCGKWRSFPAVAFLTTLEGSLLRSVEGPP
jgi:hypothetical protein